MTGRVAISLRVPPELLRRLKAAAGELGVGYQTLLLDLVDDGLSRRQAALPAAARVRVPVPLEAIHEGHFVLDVELQLATSVTDPPTTSTSASRERRP